MKTQNAPLSKEAVQTIELGLAPWDDPRSDVWDNAIVEAPEEYQEFINGVCCEGCHPTHSDGEVGYDVLADETYNDEA